MPFRNGTPLERRWKGIPSGKWLYEMVIVHERISQYLAMIRRRKASTRPLVFFPLYPLLSDQFSFSTHEAILPLS